ncbi:MAG TPA: hypothetical protein VL069_08390 [Opitutus sp.]|nr:hypothetical protein [Opitutus sp.]
MRRFACDPLGLLGFEGVQLLHGFIFGRGNLGELGFALFGRRLRRQNRGFLELSEFLKFFVQPSHLSFSRKPLLLRQGFLLTHLGELALFFCGRLLGLQRGKSLRFLRGLGSSLNFDFAFLHQRAARGEFGFRLCLVGAVARNQEASGYEQHDKNREFFHV